MKSSKRHVGRAIGISRNEGVETHERIEENKGARTRVAAVRLGSVLSAWGQNREPNQDQIPGKPGTGTEPLGSVPLGSVLVQSGSQRFEPLSNSDLKFSDNTCI